MDEPAYVLLVHPENSARHLDSQFSRPAVEFVPTATYLTRLSVGATEDASVILL